MVHKTSFVRQFFIILLVGVTFFALFRYYNTSEGFQTDNTILFTAKMNGTNITASNNIINKPRGSFLRVTGGQQELTINGIDRTLGGFLQDVKIEYLKGSTWTEITSLITTTNPQGIRSTSSLIGYANGSDTKIKIVNHDGYSILKTGKATGTQIPLPAELSKIGPSIKISNISLGYVPGDIKPNVDNIKVSLTFR
jgi:hypothetical protein